MRIYHQALYRTHQQARNDASPWEYRYYEYFLPMLLFAAIGAITWAIRGTDGWNGVDGALLPGLTWGLLWTWLCWRKGIDARGLPLWLGLGIALGGELGYGQYVSWIQGRFNTGEGVIAISPWQGFCWFFLCGIGWGAPGGILLGWTLQGRGHRRVTPLRIALFITLLLILFVGPLTDLFGALLLRIAPGLLYPNAALGIYEGELGKHLSRTVYTNTQNAAMVIWWIAALITAWRLRDKSTLRAGLLIGGGFGFGFALSALWCLGYSYAPHYVDWWKIWELQAGVNLGLLYALLYTWQNKGLRASTEEEKASPSSTRLAIMNALAAALILFIAFVTHWVFTGVALSISYGAAILTAGRQDRRFSLPDGQQAKRVSILFSIFLLLFTLLHGGVSRLTLILELRNPEIALQYSWPWPRIFLFAPPALVLLCVTLFYLYKILRYPDRPLERFNTRLSEKLIDLMTFTAFIGAASIWPAKIGILYAFFLGLALFAFTRLNQHFNYLALKAGQKASVEV